MRPQPRDPSPLSRWRGCIGRAGLRRRLMSALWASGVLASIGLTAWGLLMTLLLFGYPDAFVRERTGHGLIFIGAAASVTSAAWTIFTGQRWPVVSAVAAPALLVGLPDLTGSDSSVTFFGAIIALPAAFAGLLYGLGRRTDAG